MNFPGFLKRTHRRRTDEMAQVERQLELAKAKMPAEIVEAHVHSSNHRNEILSSKSCGCFYCLETFNPTDITEWIDDGKCALCPGCGIDSVLGDRSGYPLDKAFLGEMHKYWFEN